MVRFLWEFLVHDIASFVPVHSCEDSFVWKPGMPLAMNVLTSNSACYRDIAASCPSATLVRNDSIVVAASVLLLFGGMGTLGCGMLHGCHSFETFIHARPEMDHPLLWHQSLLMDLWLFRYNPVPPVLTRITETCFEYIPDIPVLYLVRWLVLMLFGAVVDIVT